MNTTRVFIPPETKFRGGILDSSCSSVRLSVRLSVRPSVRPSVQLNPRKQRVSLQLMTSCCINFAIISNGFTSPFGKKEKKNCHLYNTILSLFISRHYKKSLLRSQIYHGYEELSTDINYPIWRRQKLPYMKKTRKKKQVCGAACFMAAEIKFSEDVRPWVGVRMITLILFSGFKKFFLHISLGSRSCMGLNISVLPH